MAHQQLRRRNTLVLSLLRQVGALKDTESLADVCLRPVLKVPVWRAVFACIPLCSPSVLAGLPLSQTLPPQAVIRLLGLDAFYTACGLWAKLAV